jgi:hypothetical protein
LQIASSRIIAAGLLAALSLGAETPVVGKTSMTVNIAMDRNDRVLVTYRLAKRVTALHFAQELGGYRAQDWTPVGAQFHWTNEGTGERLERTDGKSFATVSFRIPRRYRALPKSYAPFSPFSEGSVLIHSGQFHACLAKPCSGSDPVPMRIVAPGKTVGVSGKTLSGGARFVSRDEGTNVFVGKLAPVKANGFVAIVDPGLPDDVRRHLDTSLPLAMGDFATIYGPLSFRPELYVSIDARLRSDGHESTQGGTLPKQIFMHFDGTNARKRLSKGSPYWLDWFFAHEAAHLVQQDKVGKTVGDDKIAWIHEGGADAMAALRLIERGDKERAYVMQRMREAEASCGKGLAAMPLDRASESGNFDLHYQCGLLIWLALDGEIRRNGKDGLDALNRAFFARVRGGAAWDQRSLLSAARDLGASVTLIGRIERLNDGGYEDASAEIASLRIASGDR